MESRIASLMMRYKQKVSLHTSQWFKINSATAL